MILADTSIWIAHLRGTDRHLARWLDAGRVLMHPFVVGELACGYLRNRREVLTLLQALPGTPVATEEEALAYVERHKLMGRGIGWIDVHLLTAAALAGTARLWTADRRLKDVAADLKLAFTQS